MNNNLKNISNYEKQKRLIKYILLAVSISVLLKYIPDVPISLKNIMTITTIICSLFVIIDTISPSISINKI